MSDDVVSETFDFEVLRRLVQFAYEHGYHELGYDPVKEIERRNEELQIALDDAWLKDAEKLAMLERNLNIERQSSSAALRAFEQEQEERIALQGELAELAKHADHLNGRIVALDDRLSNLRVALENARIAVCAERWDEFEEIVNEAFRHDHAQAG